MKARKAETLKVLSTGMSGMVGRRVEELLGWKFMDMSLDRGVDITDKTQIEEFVEANPAKVLVHMAAFTDVNKAWEERDEKDGVVYKVNVKGTQNLAEACSKRDMHMIYISTDMVFSGDKDEPYVEQDKPDPIEWYGETKALGEEKIKEIVDSYTIARIAFPFKAGREGKTDLVDKIRIGLEEGTLYPQFADMIITPTFADDIAKALDEMIGVRPVGIYHVTGSSFVSTYQLAQEVAQVFGFGKEQIKKGSLGEYMEENADIRPYQMCLKMDNSKMERELGVKMKTIREALEEIREQEK